MRPHLPLLPRRSLFKNRWTRTCLSNRAALERATCRLHILRTNQIVSVSSHLFLFCTTFALFSFLLFFIAHTVDFGELVESVWKA